MAGQLPPKTRALLDALRALSLPGEEGEIVRALIDQVEAEVSDLMLRLQRKP